jgi:hypothetical protein
VKFNPGLLWQKQHSTVRKLFQQQTGRKFKEDTSEVLYLGHSFVWCSDLDTSERRLEKPGKF